MSKQKKAFYLTEHVRLCEDWALEELDLTEDELMLRAGEAAFNSLKKLYPDVRVIAVFCGGGNNAGDGYVLARLAHEQGFSVTVHAYKPIENLPVAANHAALQAISAGVSFQRLDEGIDSDAELVVDALLGIGLKGTVHGSIAQAIQLINDSNLPVLALDIPSGLDADTGSVLGACVNATITVTFIAPKVGLFTLDGPDHCGKIVSHSLQLDSYLATLEPAAYRLDEQLFHGLLVPRLKNSHKGLYGHVLVIGGGPGMPGAPYLAALAALRCGAGMVTVATRPEYADRMLALLPEALVYGVKNEQELLPLLAKATVCIIGPGLGENEWGESLFREVIAAHLTLVVDASALRILGKRPQYEDNWILTPHPGEAASLLACSTATVQLNRCKSAQLIQEQYGGCVVLKGCGTVINTGEHESYICTAGNPGMASAGMGDVLSGIIGGLLAQGVLLADAAKLGVWLHARAGDEAVSTQGERGLIASDLMPYLRRLINKCT